MRSEPCKEYPMAWAFLQLLNTLTEFLPLSVLYNIYICLHVGIQVELDEIESRNEEYPMAWAFLQLLNTLTEFLSVLYNIYICLHVGIQVELDEIESRNEEYPMTRAFLQLLDTLTDIPIPAGLGAGFRAPGFDPYLDYIIQSVFLKFNSRAYRKSSEKVSSWSVVLGLEVKRSQNMQLYPRQHKTIISDTVMFFRLFNSLMSYIIR